jgi:hypothetical protein
MLDARRLAQLAVIALVAYPVAHQVGVARAIGDRLSPIADRYSEANTLRAVDGYRAEGLLSHAGLPDTAFGDRIPRVGHETSAPTGYVDTHYPPGPMWLAYGMAGACGTERIACLRGLPIAVGAVSLAALALGLVGLLGPLRGVLAASAVVAIPLVTNMMHGLHYQGYAFALLLVQLLLVLRFYERGAPSWRGLGGASFALGFLQGWLSFDYFFLVALCPLPFAALLSDLGRREQRRALAGLVVSGAAGFGLAHGLHFVQVVGFHGGLAAAAADLLGSALERFDPARTRELRGTPLGPAQTDPLVLASFYLQVVSAHSNFFGFRLGVLLLALLVGCFLLGGRSFAIRAARARVVLGGARPWGAALALGTAVACLWIVSMRGHALAHQHFVPRHLFLAYFAAVYATLRSVRVERSPEPWADGPAPHEADPSVSSSRTSSASHR